MPYLKSGIRKKTRYIGVYFRYGKNRYTSNGNTKIRDTCFDIHYRIKGKDIWEKVGWVSEGYKIEDAIELRQQRVKTLRHPELCADINIIKSTTLNEVWATYEKTWLPGLKSGINIKFNYNKYIEPVFGKLPVDVISPLNIDVFKQRLLASSLASSSVKQIMADLRRIINKSKAWGMSDEKSTKLLTVNFNIANADNPRERFLTPQEVERLFDALQFVSCSLYHISLISLYAGLRLGEIVTLQGQDIDLESGVIYIDGKAGKRHAYISENLKNVLEKIIPKSPSEYLFSHNDKPIRPKWVSQLFPKIVNEIGLNLGITNSSQKVVFHTLRHTFCSWLAIKGVPLFTIGNLVGHKTVSMTQRYAKLSPDCKRDALKYIGETINESTMPSSVFRRPST